MLVILDDITILEWIGFPLVDIIHFSRALRALCQKVRFLSKRFFLFHTYWLYDVFLRYSSTRLYSFDIISSIRVIPMSCIDTCFKYVPTIWRFSRSRVVVAVPSLGRLVSSPPPSLQIIIIRSRFLCTLECLESQTEWPHWFPEVILYNIDWQSLVRTFLKEERVRVCCRVHTAVQRKTASVKNKTALYEESMQSVAAL